MEGIKAITDKLASLIPADKKPILDELANEVYLVKSGQKRLEISSWKGYNFAPSLLAKSAQYAYEDLDFDLNSVFVCTFLKTGTLWVTQIVRNILFGHNEEWDSISRLYIPPIGYLEMFEGKKHEALKYIPLPRKVYGTHLPAKLLNIPKIIEKKGKFIHVVRNPKDQAVSLFHFMQLPNFESIREDIPKDWSKFLQSYVGGNFPLISKEGEWYPEYLKDWNEYCDNENFLFICFEDLKKDIKSQIRRIAEFLDVKLTDERVEEIAMKTSFEYMKKKSSNVKGDEVDKFVTKMKLIREGRVGSWKEVFTVAQSEQMDKIIEEKLGKTNISFTYEL